VSRGCVAILLLVVGGLGACAGDLADPEKFADCPPGYVEQLFQADCSGGGDCHDSSEPEADLDLVSPGAAARLMGVASVQETCEGAPLIDPAGGDHLLMQKLGDGPPCGARMPFGEAKLSRSDIECVRRWVEEAVASEGGGS
jgi:hypothetical protein